MLIDIIFWLVAVFCLCAGVYCLVVYKDKVPPVVKIVFWAILMLLAMGAAVWFLALYHTLFYPLEVDVHAPIMIYGVYFQ